MSFLSVNSVNTCSKVVMQIGINMFLYCICSVVKYFKHHKKKTLTEPKSKRHRRKQKNLLLFLEAHWLTIFNSVNYILTQSTFLLIVIFSQRSKNSTVYTCTYVSTGSVTGTPKLLCLSVSFFIHELQTTVAGGGNICGYLCRSKV